MHPIPIAVNGAAGRMGRRLVALAHEDPDLSVAAALERAAHPELGRDAGELAAIGPIGVPLSEELPATVEVLLDFSTPESTRARLPICVRHGCNAVIGTTGLTPEVESEIQLAASTIAILASPNMSVGVNVLFKLAGQVAKAMGDDVDIEIVEAHHRFKKDAPSGTAKRLGQVVADALGRDLARDAVYGRQGITGERPRTAIGMHAIRAGDVVGEHTVCYATLGERIELRHVAHSRDTFVRGALRAAKFLAAKRPGLYSMADVLGL